MFFEKELKKRGAGLNRIENSFVIVLYSARQSTGPTGPPVIADEIMSKGKYILKLALERRSRLLLGTNLVDEKLRLV